MPAKPQVFVHTLQLVASIRFYLLVIGWQWVLRWRGLLLFRPQGQVLCRPVHVRGTEHESLWSLRCLCAFQQLAVIVRNYLRVDGWLWVHHRLGLLVFRPKGKVLCRPVHMWGIELDHLPSLGCLCVGLQLSVIARKKLILDGKGRVHLRVSLLVSRPDGKVSCEPGHVLGPKPSQLQSVLSCSRRSDSKLRSASQMQAAAASVLGALRDGRMWCLLGPAPVSCRLKYGECILLHYHHSVMGRRGQ